MKVQALRARSRRAGFPNIMNIPPKNAVSRRSFLARGLTATLSAASGLTAAGLLKTDETHAAEIGPLTHRRRALRAYGNRHRAALLQKRATVFNHPTNGDEEQYVG